MHINLDSNSNLWKLLLKEQHVLELKHKQLPYNWEKKLEYWRKKKLWYCKNEVKVKTYPVMWLMYDAIGFISYKNLETYDHKTLIGEIYDFRLSTSFS